MALQGTLDTFALADLVRLLAATAKTGELAIDGDRGIGRLWFDNGDLVGGEPTLGGGVANALFELLRFDQGSFRFEVDVAPDAERRAESALDVLSAAETRLEAWRAIEALVPSLGVSLALRAEIDADDIVLTRDLWRRLVAVGGGTTAGGFGSTLGLDEVGAATEIKDLVDRGLIEVGPDLGAPTADDEAPDPLAVESLVDDPLASDPLVVEPRAVDAPSEPRPSLRSLSRDVGPQGWAAANDACASHADPLVGDPLTDADTPELLPSLDVSEPEAEPLDLLASLDGPVHGCWTLTAVPELTDEHLDDGPVAETEPSVATDADGRLPDLDAPVSGSLAVDLDSHLSGSASGHSYLAGGSDDGSLPEPLPPMASTDAPAGDEAPDASHLDPDAGADSEPDVDEPEAAPVVALPVADTGAGDDADADGEPERAAWPAPTTGEQELALQLGALSPAAARAVATAASSGSEDGEETDAGRRVLRRIISSGRG